MGRTLHYVVTKKKSNFTRKEMETFIDISEKYNSGWYENIWSCEIFYLDPLDYYPNWKRYGGTVDSWEEVNKRYDELKETNMHRLDIVKQLKKEKLIRYQDEDEDMLRRASGSTKVQGNELNSLLVLTALLEISRKCPKCGIHLSDEGEFLYWDLFIQNGKVLPDLKDLKYELKRWLAISFIGSNSDNLIAFKNSSGFKLLDDSIIRDLDLDNCYCDTAKKYLPKLIKKIAIVFDKIKQERTCPEYLCIHNIKNLDPKSWFSPKNWFRPVDIEKFKNYKISPNTLMDGFEGEGFGLADPADKKSAKMMEQILGMLSNSGVMKKGMSMDIIGVGSFEYTGDEKEK